MKFGETKSYWAVFVVFLILVCSSLGQTQKQQDCPNGRNGGNPPWFNPGKNCKFKVMPYHYEAAGGIYINREQRRCKEVILVCGTMMVRESVVARDPGCGGAFWPDPKDGDEVCCEAFQKAVESKQPCDPSKDADCDGILNENDSNPFKADPPDPDADNKCKQLHFDVYTAYRKAGANGDTATDAGHAAQRDCIKRRTDKLCGIPEPEPPAEETPKFPKDPDTDNKCKQLGQEIYEAYLSAGANRDTALHGGEIARHDCIRRRGSKL